MIEKIDLNITGMDCADCALTLEKGIGGLDGVDQVQVNFAVAKMTIVGDVDETAVRGYIKHMGYGVTEKGAPVTILSGWPLFLDLLKRPRNLLTLIGLFFVLLAFISALLHTPEITTTILFAVGGLVGLYFPARSGWMALRSGQGLDINILMTIAAVGAFFIGEYGEAATVIVLFSLGEALEGFTMERARDSIRSLMLLAPSEAMLLVSCQDCEEHLGQTLPDGSGDYLSGPCPWCGTHEQVVPIEGLKIADLILVKPGERIPMDGRVQAGFSSVNQAPITGESIPVDKEPSADVFAGTINGEGALEIEITHLAADNTLARMIHLVEEAQTQKTPTQRFVDRFSRVYTPAVVVFAILIAAVPPLFFGQPFLDSAAGHGWLYRALAMLVVACPCALVIATPVTVVSAISTLARRGVLVKGGAHLESLGAVQVMAFDKTGTLTHGRPEITALACVDHDSHQDKSIEHLADCKTCQRMLTLAAAVERRSTHPLARTVTRAGQRHQLPEWNAQDVVMLPGRGVRGVVNGSVITVGRHELFHERDLHIDFCDQIEIEESSGQTVMLVAENEHILGYLAVSDPLRHNSRDSITALKEIGIRRTVMLTGDNPVVAEAVGRAVGVDDVHASLSPEDKLKAVQSLRDQYTHVAMIGDGVNDAPALAAAELGIAMGGAGTSQALETADVALMADDLAQLPLAIRLGAKAAKTIQYNIWFALGIKAVFLVAAVLGVATMWMAVFADMGASLIVTLNGMRLLRAPKN
ncbi:MAG: heavy metal translocating P-type ATPase [Chloroflexota bacterium]